MSDGHGARKKYRMVPSEQAGYGPGKFVVQYFDHEVRAWFDVGDPLDRAEASERLKAKRTEQGGDSGD